MKLLKKTAVGQRRVYDIEVEDVHNFYANGINVHNCATDGGVSVIKDDGTVVDYLTAGSPSTFVIFTSDNRLGIWIKSAINSINMLCVTNAHVGTYVTDQTNITTNANLTNYSANSATTPTESIYLYGAGYNRFWDFTELPYGFSAANVSGSQEGGFNLVDENPTTPAKGMVAYTTSTYNTGWMNGDIKGAFLSDTDDTDLVGGELVTNGTFDTDVSGWNDNGGSYLTLSWSAGVAKLTPTGVPFSSWYGISQNIQTVVGRTYAVSAEFTCSSGTSLGSKFRIGGAVTGDYVANGVNVVYFTATSTSTQVQTFHDGPLAEGEYFTIDNISVKLADADRSVNG